MQLIDDVKTGPLRNDVIYKYQSRILNPRSRPFPRDRKRLVKLGFKKKKLEKALEVIRKIRIINEILKVSYGTPTLGNLEDPIDEFVYITISQKTMIQTAYRVFSKLKNRFSSWGKMLENEEEAAEILKEGGRGVERHEIIKRVFSNIIGKYGELSLDNLEEMSNNDMREILIKELGIGEKAAYCIMLYSFNRDIFPIDSNIIRLMKRLGFMRNLVNLAQGHKKIQSLIAPVFPTDIAHSFHVNAVVHGKVICKSNPKCESCPIVKFCDLGKQWLFTNKERGPMKLIDLFAGPGGLSLGFIEKSWKIEYAVENDDCACETYRFNHPSVSIEQRDMRNLTSKKMRSITGEVDAIVAGVPCQGFSLVGYRVRPDLEEKPDIHEDERNDLYRLVFRAIRVHRPKVVVFENVPGMLTGRVSRNGVQKNVIGVLEREFDKLRYRSAKVKLNAEEYGVPQKRRRLFVFGSRVGDPESIISKIEEKTSELRLTVNDAIGDILQLTHNDGNPIMGDGTILHGESAIWGPSDPHPVVIGHISRPHNKFDMEIISALAEGMTYRQLYDERPDIFKKRKKSRKVKFYRIDNFHDKFYRLDGDEPSRTIVSHLAKDGNGFIHPSQNRSLTPREAARLQGFPDDYIFFGSRSAQFVQIGNAVPPPLAAVIAEAIQEHIHEFRK